MPETKEPRRAWIVVEEDPFLFEPVEVITIRPDVDVAYEPGWCFCAGTCHCLCGYCRPCGCGCEVGSESA